MSQAKVDRYKMEKANRKETVKKEKMARQLSQLHQKCRLEDTQLLQFQRTMTVL